MTYYQLFEDQFRIPETSDGLQECGKLSTADRSDFAHRI